MNSLSSFGIWQLMEAVAQNVDGGLKKVDVATQENVFYSYIYTPIYDNYMYRLYCIEYCILRVL